MELGKYSRYNPRRRKHTLPYYTISDSQRLRHIYCIGKTGVGKSTALINWANKDIRNGRGCLFIDPHGHDAETLLSLIPTNRRNDVIFFAPAEYPIALNLFDQVPPNRHSFVATSIVDTFKSVFKLDDFPAPNIEMFVKASCLALLETPGSTLLGLNYILTSPTYRKKVVGNIKDPIIKNFWEQTFAEHMTEKEQRDRTLSTVNKIFQLITDPAIRYCVGQEKSGFDFQNVIINHKIFIASLPQGELGTQLSSVIGSFLLAAFHTAALQRKEYSLFPVYIDEFQKFSQFTIMEMLAGIRKQGICVVLAHHYTEEVSPELRAAIFGTVGNIVAFAVGPLDAELLAKQFEQKIKPDDLIKLPPYRALAHAGKGTVDLHMPPVEAKAFPSAPARIRANCRTRYSRPIDQIEAEISAFIAATMRPPTKERRETETRRSNARGWLDKPAQWSPENYGAGP